MKTAVTHHDFEARKLVKSYVDAMRHYGWSDSDVMVVLEQAARAFRKPRAKRLKDDRTMDIEDYLGQLEGKAQ
jgi:hypothetical protein